MATKTDPLVQVEGLSRQVAGEKSGTHLPRLLDKPGWKKAPLIVLGVLLLISIGSELAKGSSICAQLRIKYIWADRLLSAIAPLFRSNSVLKVTETIGVCSILIAWIYASLDKVELGIRYDELVRRKLPGYHGYVAAHFISVLMCLWLCKAAMVEGAVLVLCGVLYASWLQWNVLNSVILSSKRRGNIAIAVWQDKVKASAQNVDESKKLALDMISVIVGKRAAETIQLQKEFVAVVLNYEERCRAEDTEGGIERAVEDVSWFWEQLLQGAGKSERIYRTRELFSCCDKDGCDYGVICAGYVLWLLNDTIMRAEQAGKTEEEALGEVRNILGITARGKIERTMAWLQRDWHMIFAMIVYQCFLRRTIESIPKNLQTIWSRQPGSCPTRDKSLLRAVSEVYFSESNERMFLGTICWMWKNGASQEVEQ